MCIKHYLDSGYRYRLHAGYDAEGNVEARFEKNLEDFEVFPSFHFFSADHFLPDQWRDTALPTQKKTYDMRYNPVYSTNIINNNDTVFYYRPDNTDNSGQIQGVAFVDIELQVNIQIKNFLSGEWHDTDIGEDFWGDFSPAMNIVLPLKQSNERKTSACIPYAVAPLQYSLFVSDIKCLGGE